MRRIVVALWTVVALLAVAASGDGGDKKDKNKGSDGTWVVTELEQDGMKVPADIISKLGMKLTIKGENYSLAMADKVVDKGTSKVDEQKKPNTLDIKASEGKNQGKTIQAIVEIDGDSMKACYDMEGKGRPTEFATKQGSGHVLILYKREKKSD